MIAIEREPEIGGPMERCCFCRLGTKFWTIGGEVAVCPSCAAMREPEELPSKAAWCAAEKAVGALRAGLEAASEAGARKATARHVPRSGGDVSPKAALSAIREALRQAEREINADGTVTFTVTEAGAGALRVHLGI